MTECSYAACMIKMIAIAEHKKLGFRETLIPRQNLARGVRNFPTLDRGRLVERLVLFLGADTDPRFMYHPSSCSVVVYWFRDLLLLLPSSTKVAPKKRVKPAR
jgi:hypothetical protein